MTTAGAPTGAARPRVVLVTAHYLKTDRKAGFHWLAHALNQLGFDVTMMTTSISWLSELRREHRTRYGLRNKRHRTLDRSGEIASIVWWTRWHPGNLRHPMLNRLAAPLYRTYGSLPLGECEDLLRSADVVLFDTGAGLDLVERAKALNPEALYLLRASDDLRAMKQHQVILDTDRRVAPLFDDVSAPSNGVADYYRPIVDVHVDHHGIATGLFDRSGPSPYASSGSKFRAHAVFVGNGSFDHEFLRRASAMAPDVCFHIIGPIAGVVQSPNVVVYGEIPFEVTVPYVVHADIGLHTLDAGEFAATFTHSLKVRQYAYCRLPILAPTEIPVALPNVFFYERTDESIRQALDGALTADRSAAQDVKIDDWTDLARRIVERGAERRTRDGRKVSESVVRWISAQSERSDVAPERPVDITRL